MVADRQQHTRPSRSIAAPLHRNQACTTCRSRKVRCDARRPACSACIRSATAQGLNTDTLACEYPNQDKNNNSNNNNNNNSNNNSASNGAANRQTSNGPSSSGKPGRPQGRTRVAELEAKIAQLENAINNRNNNDNNSDHNNNNNNNNNNNTSTGAFSTNLPTPLTQSTSFSGTGAFDDFMQFKVPTNFQQQPAQEEGTSMFSTTQYSANIPDGTANNTATATGNATISPAANITSEEPSPDSSGDETLRNLIWPGWPKSLPAPPVIHQLLSLYFRVPHAGTGIVDQAKFLTAMNFPPTYSKFPPSFLIHAICAIASVLPGACQLGLDRETYWRSCDTPTAYHALRAKEEVDHAFAGGRQPFRLIQAIVLLCIHSYIHAKFIQIWCYTGLALRISTPIGLNNLERSMSPTPNVEGFCANRYLLPPPSDESERRERAYTFWAAVSCERFCSANTGWAHSLSDMDLFTLIPALHCDESNYQNPMQNYNALSPESPTFFTCHPNETVGPTQLFFKSITLISRASTFAHRNIPGQTYPDALTGELIKVPDARQSTEFKQLESQIAAFRLSFPEKYRDITFVEDDGYLNNQLILAHALPLVAHILLYEPYIDQPDGDKALDRCVTAARGIIAIIIMIWSSGGIKVCMVQPYVYFTFSVAGRILARELKRQHAKGDKQGQDNVNAELDVILSVLGYDNPPPIATLMAHVIRMMKADPELCGYPPHLTKALSKKRREPNFPTNNNLEDIFSSTPAFFQQDDTPASAPGSKSTPTSSTSAPTRTDTNNDTYYQEKGCPLTANNCADMDIPNQADMNNYEDSSNPNPTPPAEGLSPKINISDSLQFSTFNMNDIKIPSSGDELEQLFSSFTQASYE